MSARLEQPTPKLLEWIGSSKDDLCSFPDPGQGGRVFSLPGQIGMKALKAKPLRGFGGAGVLEIIANHDGSTYRAVYTVKFAEAVFVLHAFQKKSKRGIATPKADLDLIKRRLKIAEGEYQRLFGGN